MSTEIAKAELKREKWVPEGGARTSTEDSKSRNRKVGEFGRKGMR